MLQMPQLRGSFVVLTSQPFETMPSQFAKPVLHVAMPHCPAIQSGTALGSEHARPQPLQLFGSVCVVVLQPVVLPVQLEYGAVQLKAHALAALQTAIAFVYGPQAAQVVRSPQPFAGVSAV